VQRVVVELIKGIDGIPDEYIVDRIVVSCAVIDIGGRIEIDRDGSERFGKTVPELQVRAVDIEPRIFT